MRNDPSIKTVTARKNTNNLQINIPYLRVLKYSYSMYFGSRIKHTEHIQRLHQKCCVTYLEYRTPHQRGGGQIKNLKRGPMEGQEIS